ncbi:MAG TPA: TlpA disulfide reductase family protein [Steroidobacteraceae bacterium]|nr:TlpA disulfide reductase family protein [Steroidobacteraceae bacterium]
MSLPTLAAALLGLTLLGSQCALAAPPLPRQSPEFSIKAPDGETTQLSGFKGKVVVLEFLFVRSQHCIRVAQTLNQLQGEMGARGLQAVGVAFDAPNAAVTGGEYLSAMTAALNLTYPVGYAEKQSVDTYLGRTGNELLSIPQMVIIDRTGTIRAVTGSQTNPALENPDALRTLLASLLAEPAKH